MRFVDHSEVGLGRLEAEARLDQRRSDQNEDLHQINGA
jgi:hypothetical protein